MIICFDGDYPELSRITARARRRGHRAGRRPCCASADIWELTNRARAYDNHVYVVGANATGIDPAGVLYFGNSHDRHAGRRGRRPGRQHEGWVSARLDPATALASLTPGLERPPGLRPPRRPQPRPDQAVRSTTWPARRHPFPHRRAPTSRPSPWTRRASRHDDGTVPVEPDGSASASTPAARSPTSSRSTRTTGELVTTKTPSTPANPADGFIAGVAQGARRSWARPATTSPRSATARRSRPTSCSRARSSELGFITTEGYEFILEIARQAVPDGYGNSYFWVKPPRIVPADRVRDRRRPARLRGQRGPPVRRGAARSRPPAGSATAASTRSASASCTPTPTPTTSCAMREVLRREHPDAVVSISSDVLREYREYERSMTTLVDAAVKPNDLAATSPTSRSRLDDFTGAGRRSRSRSTS